MWRYTYYTLLACTLLLTPHPTIASTPSFSSNDLLPGVTIALQRHITQLSTFYTSFSTEDECLTHMNNVSGGVSENVHEEDGWSVKEVDLKMARYWRCYFLRDLSKIDMQHDITERPNSMGGSNSGNNILFIGKEKKFLLKTMRENELTNLLRADNTPPTWQTYLIQRRGISLLPKFLAIFSLTHTAKNIKTHLVLFPNVYYHPITPTPPTTTTVYDFKSSRPPERCWANVSTKYFGNYYIHFGAHTPIPNAGGTIANNRFWDVLTSDFQFLDNHQLIMGSSLLVVSSEYDPEGPLRCPGVFRDSFTPHQIVFASSKPVFVYPDQLPSNTHPAQLTGPRSLTSPQQLQQHNLIPHTPLITHAPHITRGLGWKGGIGVGPGGGGVEGPAAHTSGMKCVVSYIGLIDVIASPPKTKEKLEMIGHLGQRKFDQHSHYMSCLIGRFVAHHNPNNCPPSDKWDCDYQIQIATSHPSLEHLKTETKEKLSLLEQQKAVLHSNPLRKLAMTE